MAGGYLKFTLQAALTFASAAAALIIWVSLLISPFSAVNYSNISVTYLASLSTIYVAAGVFGFIFSSVVDFWLIRFEADTMKAYRFVFFGYHLYTLLSGTVLMVAFWSLYHEAGGGDWTLLRPSASLDPSQAVLAQVIGGVAIVFTTTAVYLAVKVLSSYASDDLRSKLRSILPRGMFRTMDGAVPLMNPNSRFQAQRR